MAEKATTKASAPEVSVEPRVLLDEFCRRLSQSVKRPELIAGFHYTQKASGTASATPAAFQAAYEQFVNKPI